MFSKGVLKALTVLFVVQVALVVDAEGSFDVANFCATVLMLGTEGCVK